MMSLLGEYKRGLDKSKKSFIGKLEDLFKSNKLDDALYEELEEILISGDVGVETTQKIIESLRLTAIEQRISNGQELKSLLSVLINNMVDKQVSLAIKARPHIILLVGVNGSGKTTTAAKLAKYYKDQDKKVLMVAGDTFRSAAIDQIQAWSEKINVDLIKQKPGSDPSALYFDAIKAAQARNVDVVIGDTAGRLHNKENLMGELNKIYRVIGNNMPGAPHETLLVVDATTGHNALVQGKMFHETTPLSGLILTKLDGTARGGIVIGVSDQLDIPIKFIGLGEKLEDLSPFIANLFVSALLE